MIGLNMLDTLSLSSLSPHPHVNNWVVFIRVIFNIDSAKYMHISECLTPLPPG